MSLFSLNDKYDSYTRIAKLCCVIVAADKIFLYKIVYQNIFVVLILISFYHSGRVVRALPSMRTFERLLKDERKGQFIVFVVGQRWRTNLPTHKSRSGLACIYQISYIRGFIKGDIFFETRSVNICSVRESYLFVTSSPAERRED